MSPRLARSVLRSYYSGCDPLVQASIWFMFTSPPNRPFNMEAEGQMSVAKVCSDSTRRKVLRVNMLHNQLEVRRGLALPYFIAPGSSAPEFTRGRHDQTAVHRIAFWLHACGCGAHPGSTLLCGCSVAQPWCLRECAPNPEQTIKGAGEEIPVGVRFGPCHEGIQSFKART